MGLGSYVIWGFFPLYFHSLEPAGALEVIAHRAFWGFLSCLVVIAVLSRWEQLRNLLRDREVIGRLTGAGFLILDIGSVLGRQRCAAFGFGLHNAAHGGRGAVVVRVAADEAPRAWARDGEEVREGHGSTCFAVRQERTQ